MANIFTLLTIFSLEFTGLERGSNQKKSLIIYRLWISHEKAIDLMVY